MHQLLYIAVAVFRNLATVKAKSLKPVNCRKFAVLLVLLLDVALAFWFNMKTVTESDHRMMILLYMHIVTLIFLFTAVRYVPPPTDHHVEVGT